MDGPRDGPTDGPTKQGVESRSTRLEIDERMKQRHLPVSKHPSLTVVDCYS